MDILHFDIWGPLSIKSIHGHSYFLTVVDDYSRFVWIILLKSKSEVQIQVQNFIIFAENQFECKVKIVRSDNGPEFDLQQFYSLKGILHKKPCVETPQQNGRVERKHQHILNVGRALLFQSKLPKFFWSYALVHATYIINRISSSILKDKSPHQLLFNQNPDFDSFKVFGSLCFASTLCSHRTKLASRARKSVFLGYKTGVKGLILFDLHTRQIFISRNVVFYEHVLPYKTDPANQFPHPSDRDFTTDTLPMFVPHIESHNHDSISDSPFTITTDHNDLPYLNQNPPIPDILDHIDDVEPVPDIRKSQRVRTIHAKLQDYVCNSFTYQSTSSSSGSLYPLSNFTSSHNLSSSQSHFTLSVTSRTEPKSYEEALQSKH